MPLDPASWFARAAIQYKVAMAIRLAHVDPSKVNLMVLIIVTTAATTSADLSRISWAGWKLNIPEKLTNIRRISLEFLIQEFKCSNGSREYGLQGT